MKYLFINVVCGIKSTGRICTDLAQSLEKEGHTIKIAYGRDVVPDQYKKYAVRIGSDYSSIINASFARVFDNDGFFAVSETKKFLKWADSYNPDILWLHNLHGYYINIKLLFDWIKTRPNMEVKWTLHDCWAFTGHCAYFSYIGCNKWKNHCYKCEQKSSYPSSYVLDRSKSNFETKKELFSGINNMTLYTPSFWLADLVKQSFLSDYSVEVVHNRINEKIFKPTSSDLREKLNIQNKFVILGVAAVWDARKGITDFYRLASLLNDSFIIIMIGLTDEQLKKIPNNIIGISRTNDQIELAKYYSLADVYFNPTYEDNYPTTNLEALACGTEVITYNTGGSPESVCPDCVCEQGDLSSVINLIENMKRQK